MKEKNTIEEPKKSKKRKVLKIILIILLVLVLIAGILLAAGYAYYRRLMGLINYEDISREDIEVNEGIEEALKGYRNIALFGIDSRKDDYGLGNRSDCIIIASINLDTKDIKLVSVYRDTYLEVKNGNLDKITHAYSYGGAALAMSKLNTNLDLDITEFVTVNFSALVDIVDAIGGVEITIEEDEIKYINAYIDGTSENTGVKADHITKTGKQKLNGVQAVAYSRIRYTAGGDYKRTERMRTVLTAIFEKVKTKNVTEIMSLLEKLLPEVSTNIKSEEITKMIPDIANYKITSSIGWPYDVNGITLDRWYGVPVTLESNVVRLHQEIFGENDYVASETVKSISQRIVEKTGYR